MTKKTDTLSGAPASNAGDDFHLLWTARRALRLLDPASGLMGVSVEGSSSVGKNAAGELGIDTAEYYGGNDEDTATRIAYYQHKHSVAAPRQPMKASDLDEPVAYFAERHNAMVAKYGEKSVLARFSYTLITNRPISANVLAALKAAREGKIEDIGKAEKNALDRIVAVTKLTGQELNNFLSLLDLPGGEPGHLTQSSLLEREATTFVAGRDPDVFLRLRKLIHDRTLPEARHFPPLKKDDVLAALNVTAGDLFPAAPAFPLIETPIPRDHDRIVAAAVVTAQAPVIVRAPGGTGKTVLAQHLPTLLPAGSVAVVFDGFANGDYRRLTRPRHLARIAITQICNELSVQGLCDPLIPLETPDHEYYEAFRSRLEQAAAAVRARAPGAVVAVILDAADNSVMAAIDNHDKPFVWGLLEQPPPEGCRVIAFARPYRADTLRPCADYVAVDLDGFTSAESALNLRKRFPEADDVSVETFHRLTDGNPRVQGYFLEEGSAESVATLIACLRTGGRTVDDLIAETVEKALARLKGVVEDGALIDQFCFLLGQLPPLVPVTVLATAAGVPEGAARDFVSDLRHPLMIRDGCVQFRDLARVQRLP